MLFLIKSETLIEKNYQEKNLKNFNFFKFQFSPIISMIFFLSLIDSIITIFQAQSINFLTWKYLKYMFGSFKKVSINIIKFMIFFAINFTLLYGVVFSLKRVQKKLKLPKNVAFILTIIIILFRIHTWSQINVLNILGVFSHQQENQELMNNIQRSADYFGLILPHQSIYQQNRLTLINNIRRLVYKYLLLKDENYDFFTRYVTEENFSAQLGHKSKYEVFKNVYNKSKDYQKKLKNKEEITAEYKKESKDLFDKLPAYNDRFTKPFFYDIYSLFVPFVWNLLWNRNQMKKPFLRILLYTFLVIYRVYFLIKIVIYINKSFLL